MRCSVSQCDAVKRFDEQQPPPVALQHRSFIWQKAARVTDSDNGWGFVAGGCGGRT